MSVIKVKICINCEKQSELTNEKIVALPSSTIMCPNCNELAFSVRKYETNDSKDIREWTLLEKDGQPVEEKKEEEAPATPQQAKPGVFFSMPNGDTQLIDDIPKEATEETAKDDSENAVNETPLTTPEAATETLPQSTPTDNKQDNAPTEPTKEEKTPTQNSPGNIDLSDLSSYSKDDLAKIIGLLYNQLNNQPKVPVETKEDRKEETTKEPKEAVTEPPVSSDDSNKETDSDKSLESENGINTFNPSSETKVPKETQKKTEEGFKELSDDELDQMSDEEQKEYFLELAKSQREKNRIDSIKEEVNETIAKEKRLEELEKRREEFEKKFNSDLDARANSEKAIREEQKEKITDEINKAEVNSDKPSTYNSNYDHYYDDVEVSKLHEDIYKKSSKAIFLKGLVAALVIFILLSIVVLLPI